MRILVGSYPEQVIAKVGKDDYLTYFGFLASWRDRKTPEKAANYGVPWAMDNFAFTQFDPIKFEEMLSKHRAYAPCCSWVVAPDVVCNAQATLVSFWHWMPVIRSYGYKIAFAAQNGIENISIPWQCFDCLFVGGNDLFKANCTPLVREAKAHGKVTHMGRVNSLKRILFCRALGFDSADGSGYAKYSYKTAEHLPALTQTHVQPLLLEVA